MQKLNLACIEHAPFEGPAAIGEWARLRGHSMNIYRIFEDHFPDLGNYDGLVMMGGPMGVADLPRLLWMQRELEILSSYLATGKPCLGVCLGAQLIAHTLGAEVYRNKETEIGWYPVQKTADASLQRIFAHFPESFTVMHWHSDTFQIPAGATRLAFNEVTENQAFVFQENILALQFHIEMNNTAMEEIVVGAEDELIEAPHIQSKEALIAGAHSYFPQLKEDLYRMLDRLFS